MLLFVELGSGALAGLIAVLVTVIVLAMIVARMMKRDQFIRIARVGVFVQRERLDAKSEDTWTPDPFSDASERLPAPATPTPPPPLPPPEDDETQAWPHRGEDA
jgi:hypothetical protein